MLNLLRAILLIAVTTLASPAWPGSMTLLGVGKVGGGGGGGCTQATNFLARTSGLSGTETTAYTTMICGLVTDGIITGSMSGSGSGSGACGSLLDGFYILATNTTTTAALNLCSTSYGLTTTGSPSFTADQGYIGAASAHLDTGFNPSTATSPNMVANSGSAWVWVLGTLTSGTDYGSALNLANTTNFLRLYVHYSDNNFYFNMNTGGSPNDGASTGSMFGASNTALNTTVPYQNTAAGTTSGATANFANANIWLLNSGNSDPFQGRLSFAAFGAALNGTQEAALYARVHAYMQTVAGAP